MWARREGGKTTQVPHGKQHPTQLGGRRGMWSEP